MKAVVRWKIIYHDDFHFIPGYSRLNGIKTLFQEMLYIIVYYDNWKLQGAKTITDFAEYKKTITDLHGLTRIWFLDFTDFPHIGIIRILDENISWYMSFARSESLRKSESNPC